MEKPQGTDAFAAYESLDSSGLALGSFPDLLCIRNTSVQGLAILTRAFGVSISVPRTIDLGRTICRKVRRAIRNFTWPQESPWGKVETFVTYLGPSSGDFR